MSRRGALRHPAHMRRHHGLLAAAAVLAASPVITWFAVGDTSENVPDPDYMLQPPDLSGGQELVLGGFAAGLAVAGVAVLIVAVSRQLVTREDLLPAVPLLFAGILIGAAARTVTAGVIGANIGGGLVVLFGPFVVLGLVLLSAVLWRRRPG